MVWKLSCPVMLRNFLDSSLMLFASRKMTPKVFQKGPEPCAPQTPSSHLSSRSRRCFASNRRTNDDICSLMMLETSWRLLFSLLRAFELLGSRYSAFFLPHRPN